MMIIVFAFVPFLALYTVLLSAAFSWIYFCIFSFQRLEQLAGCAKKKQSVPRRIEGQKL